MVYIDYILIFFIFSFIGWLVEVLEGLINKRGFINRGFLVGPICPIYGIGSLLITFLLKKYTNDPIALFIMAIVVCGVLEYFTSYIMEKLFHARWWDYSGYKYNINGRVCLNTIIPFGILGLLIMYVLNPVCIDLLNKLSELSLNLASIGFLIAIFIDFIVSTNVITHLAKTTIEVGKDLDNTEEITKKVKEILLQKSGLYRRVLDAYPKIQAIKVRVKEKQEKIKRQISEQTTDIKQTIIKQTSEVKNKINNIKEDRNRN